VLDWLSAHPSNWSVFIANRVADIQNSTCIDNWHLVESKQNPADLVSRGVMPEKFLQAAIWFEGPQFLQESVHEWPAYKKKSRRIFTKIYRFLHNSQCKFKNQTKLTGNYTVEELDKAEI
jgi:hypothetical protein